MILVIDNYDSFTFNLVHYLMELGAEVKVVRNDAVTANEAIASNAATAITAITAIMATVRITTATVNKPAPTTMATRSPVRRSPRLSP